MKPLKCRKLLFLRTIIEEGEKNVFFLLPAVFLCMFLWTFFPLFFSSLLELFLRFYFLNYFSSFSSFFQQFFGVYLGTAVVWGSVKWELTTDFSLKYLCESDKSGTCTHMPKGNHLFHYFLVWNYYRRTKPTTCQLQTVQLKYTNKHVYIYISQKVNFLSIFLQCRADFLTCMFLTRLNSFVRWQWEKLTCQKIGRRETTENF